MGALIVLIVLGVLLLACVTQEQARIVTSDLASLQKRQIFDSRGSARVLDFVLAASSLLKRANPLLHERCESVYGHRA